MGARVAERCHHHGGPFRLSIPVHDVSESIRKTVFNSGSDDDSRIYLPLKDFVQCDWCSADAPPCLRVEGKPRDIRKAIARLKASAPDA